MNLKDKKNPGLREAVISGDLSPAKLTKMSPQVSDSTMPEPFLTCRTWHRKNDNRRTERYRKKICSSQGGLLLLLPRQTRSNAASVVSESAHITRCRFVADSILTKRLTFPDPFSRRADDNFCDLRGMRQSMEVFVAVGL